MGEHQGYVSSECRGRQWQTPLNILPLKILDGYLKSAVMAKKDILPSVKYYKMIILSSVSTVYFNETELCLFISLGIWPETNLLFFDKNVENMAF